MYVHHSHDSQNRTVIISLCVPNRLVNVVETEYFLGDRKEINQQLVCQSQLHIFRQRILLS